MREPIRDLGRLQHILEHIDKAKAFCQDRTKEDLETDPLFRYALVKCVEVIGEAAYKLTNEFRDNHPQTPWDLIIRMRHVLVHGYYQITLPLLWHTVQNDLPSLRPQIVLYIDELILAQ